MLNHIRTPRPLGGVATGEKQLGQIFGPVLQRSLPSGKAHRRDVRPAVYASSER
jgi:hypothetical protein